MTAQPSFVVASLSVAAGGGVGAWLRFAVGRMIGATPFPVATLTINVLGSLAMGLLAGALFAIEFVCLFVGLQYSGASRVTVFLYTSPLWVALVRRAQWGQRPLAASVLFAALLVDHYLF